LPAAAHRGAAFGDLNNDGKMDAVVSAIGQNAAILMTTSPAAASHWLLIETEGTRSNRDGIGTRIKLTGQSGTVQFNHVTTSVGYASSSDKRVHFGLGLDPVVREIELRWPSGKIQVLKNLKADRVLKVKEE
jgi:enediyne biosynthesis protein E4